MSAKPGYTLGELLVVLALTAILLGLAAPRAARWRDAAAVAAARDELASALASVRLAAVAHGGASLWVDPVDATFWWVGADGARQPALDLRDRYGVEVDAGARTAIEIRYDALGIGRVASRTFLFRRGAASRGLTVSAYGRARRW